jgi:hypothetical protein
MGRYSFNLFARPSFTEGMGRILDFGNTMNEYNYSSTGAEADHLALYDDWMQVCEDMRFAHDQVAGNLKQQAHVSKIRT